jgi:hypothetical protein
MSLVAFLMILVGFSPIIKQERMGRLYRLAKSTPRGKSLSPTGHRDDRLMTDLGSRLIHSIPRLVQYLPFIVVGFRVAYSKNSKSDIRLVPTASSVRQRGDLYHG